MTEPPPLKRAVTKVRESTTFKVFVIGFLVLVLLIPARMVRSLVRERERRQSGVVHEIASKWGGAQTVSGPILSLPCATTIQGPDGKPLRVTHWLHVLPDTLAVTGAVAPEVRYRGMYEVVLYNARIGLDAEFTLPDLKAMDLPEKGIAWDRAFIAVGITDRKGVREEIRARVNGSEVDMESGIECADVLGSGVSVRTPLNRRSGRITFQTDLNLNGSQRLAFAPVGKQTEVELTSSWDSPSFDGAFLPAERTVASSGFTAKWKILHLNRNYPQAWIGNQHAIKDSAFGVGLVIPTDAYRKTERMAKYAAMFIALTFLAFFLSEVLNRVRLHPFQYLLIGLALVVFYTLLLSIAEHLSFGRGYLVSSAATVLLITGYARSILKRGALAALVGAMLAILYGYLYVLLQLEDYALLLGSIGLFVILGLVMYLTRRIDWYGLNTE